METLALGFPLYIDLDGNNCVVFGGGDYATACVKTLLYFGARITVIAPQISEELRLLDEKTEAFGISRGGITAGTVPMPPCALPPPTKKRLTFPFQTSARPKKSRSTYPSPPHSAISIFPP